MELFIMSRDQMDADGNGQSQRKGPTGLTTSRIRRSLEWICLFYRSFGLSSGAK